MATLVNNGSVNINGNFQTVSKNDTLHASTNVTVDNAGYDYSGTWNGNGSNTDLGVIVFLASFDVGGGPNTVTIELQEDTGGGTWVTRASTTYGFTQANVNYPTYFFFRFSSTHLETAGTNNYRYRFSSDGSATDQVFLRGESATPTNVGVIQVLNATAVPAASDILYIVGYCDGCTDNPTSATVTINGNYNGTAFGNINIGSGGILASGTTAATTYYLEVAGNINVYPGGEFRAGTTGTRIPSDSTFTLELNTTGADRELKTFAQTVSTSAAGKLTLQGYDKFATDSDFHTTLSAQANSGQPNLTCVLNVQTSGWAANDEVIVAATGATLGESEKMTIQSVSGTGIVLTGNLTNTHKSGAHVMNITRNVMILQTGSNWGGLDLNSLAGVAPVCDIDWVAFIDQLGGAAAEHVVTFTTGTPASLDNCIFNNCTGTTAGYGYCISMADISGYSFGANKMTFSNIGIYHGTTKLGYNISIAAGECNFSHVVALKGGLQAFVNSAASATMELRNCIMVDRVSSTADATFINPSDYGQEWDLYDCIAAGIKDSGGLGGACIRVATYSGGYFKCYNCYFGNDGTNDFDCTVDVLITTGEHNLVELFNCKLHSTTPISITTAPPAYRWDQNHVAEHSVDMVCQRHRVTDYYGLVEDQITGGQTAAWARGGSGLCVYIDPNNTSVPAEWDFLVPVTAASAFQVKMYVKTTNAVNGPTMTCTIYDSDDDATVLLSAEAVSLTTSWASYTSTSKTPTCTGFCRVKMKVLDGAGGGAVGIDDVEVI